MRKFKWYDWLFGLSPIIALLADLYFDHPFTKVIFGVSLVLLIVFYIIRDYKNKRKK